MNKILKKTLLTALISSCFVITSTFTANNAYANNEKLLHLLETSVMTYQEI